MANPTTNFNWQMPTSSDLVTDLPADFETFGQAVDTSLADLKGGTSGQILSKASNTDMDFTWTTPNPGDITAVTAGTGITGGGTSGAVTVSFDQANFGGGQRAAGKNLFLNADFSVWQRGTSFSSPANATFTADRWAMYYDGSGATRTISQQTFTGDNPSGCNASYYLRWAQTVAGTGGSIANALYNKIENVRNFSGQTVTVSFWAKADASRTITLDTYQEFGTGGSGAVLANTLTAAATTSWTRFSATFTMPSVSGKTIASNSSISHILGFPLNAVGTFDVTGFQLELGSTATIFQTATGTIQGELAACQRYFFKINTNAVDQTVGTGLCIANNKGRIISVLPVTMRTSPSISGNSVGNYYVFDGSVYNTLSSLALWAASPNQLHLEATTTATTLTLGRGALLAVQSPFASIDVSAEL